MHVKTSFTYCTINALKELLDLICTPKFCNNLYINVKRISHGHVKSYFSAQRQMCGGTQNMTA